MPQKHDDEILPEEQGQSSIEEKKTRQSVKKRAKLESAPETRLAIASSVLLVIGLLYPPLTFAGMNNGNWFWFWLGVGGLFVFIGGFVGGWVTQSYWTLLSLPGLLFIGLIVGMEMVPTGLGDIAAYWAPLVYLPLFPIAAFIGTAIGTPIGVGLKKRKTKLSIPEQVT